MLDEVRARIIGSDSKHLITVNFGLFALNAVIALCSSWKFADLCWSIWLVEIVLCSALTLSLVLRTVISTEVKTEEEPHLLVSLSVIAFCFFCTFGLLSMYAIFLYTAFPIPTTKRVLSLFNILHFGWDSMWVLLPNYWSMVLGALIVKRKLLLFAPAAEVFAEAMSGNLARIHLCLIILPPIALLLQNQLGGYETLLSIVVIFIFYVPKIREPRVDRPQVD